MADGQDATPVTVGREFISDRAASASMSTEPDSNRRTVLSAIGALGLGVFAVATAAGTPDGSDADRNEPAIRAAAAEATSSDTIVDPDRTGAYVGAVDRIVDGEHVVVLLEEGDSVVDQAVVPHEEWPFLEEGDVVRVVLLRGTVLLIRPLDGRPGETG